MAVVAKKVAGHWVAAKAELVALAARFHAFVETEFAMAVVEVGLKVAH